MHQFIIERSVPGLGKLPQAELQSMAARSNGVLQGLGTGVQWLHSYVTADRMYCVYRADSEELVREHARRGGFPADAVVRVQGVLDPLSAAS